MNPWIELWIRPRQGMRYILDTKTPRHVIVIGAFLGLFLMALVKVGGGIVAFKDWQTALMQIMVIGPISAIGFIYLNGWFLTWLGRQFSGQGQPNELCSAIAWSYTALVPILMLFVLLSSKEITVAYITQLLPMTTVPSILSAIYTTFGFVLWISYLWAFIVHVHCIGEAHQLPIVKAFLAVWIDTFVVPVIFGALILISQFIQFVIM